MRVHILCGYTHMSFMLTEVLLVLTLCSHDQCWCHIDKIAVVETILKEHTSIYGDDT